MRRQHTGAFLTLKHESVGSEWDWRSYISFTKHEKILLDFFSARRQSRLARFWKRICSLLSLKTRERNVGVRWVIVLQFKFVLELRKEKFGCMLETLRMREYRKVTISRRCRRSAGKTCILGSGELLIGRTRDGGVITPVYPWPVALKSEGKVKARSANWEEHPLANRSNSVRSTT